MIFVALDYKKNESAFYLKLEQCNAERKQERVYERLDWAQNADVLNQYGIPQVTQNERHDHDKKQKDGHLVQEIASATGRQDTVHFF